MDGSANLFRLDLWFGYVFYDCLRVPVSETDVNALGKKKKGPH